MKSLQNSHNEFQEILGGILPRPGPSRADY